jgi:hypothetical protein
MFLVFCTVVLKSLGTLGTDMSIRRRECVETV